MDAIVIILSTPFLIGAIVAIIVNLALPSDDEDDMGQVAIQPQPYPTEGTTAILPQHRVSDTGIEEEQYQDKEDKLNKVEL
jgi:hypothetical protein